MATYKNAAPGWTPKLASKGDVVEHKDGTKTVVKTSVYKNASPGWVPKTASSGDRVQYQDGTFGEVVVNKSSSSNMDGAEEISPLSSNPLNPTGKQFGQINEQPKQIDTRQSRYVEPSGKQVTTYQSFDGGRITSRAEAIQAREEKLKASETRYKQIFPGLKRMEIRQTDSKLMRFGKTLAAPVYSFTVGLPYTGAKIVSAVYKAAFQADARLFGSKEQKDQARYTSRLNGNYQADAAFNAISPITRNKETDKIEWNPEGSANLVMTAATSYVAAKASTARSGSNPFRGAKGDIKVTVNKGTKPSGRSFDVTTYRFKQSVGGRTASSSFKVVGKDIFIKTTKVGSKTTILRQTAGSAVKTVVKNGQVVSSKPVPAPYKSVTIADLGTKLTGSKYTIKTPSGRTTKSVQTGKADISIKTGRISKYKGDIRFTRQSVKTTNQANKIILSESRTVGVGTLKRTTPIRSAIKRVVPSTKKGSIALTRGGDFAGRLTTGYTPQTSISLGTTASRGTFSSLISTALKSSASYGLLGGTLLGGSNLLNPLVQNSLKPIAPPRYKLAVIDPSDALPSGITGSIPTPSDNTIIKSSNDVNDLMDTVPVSRPTSPTITNITNLTQFNSVAAPTNLKYAFSFPKTKLDISGGSGSGFKSKSIKNQKRVYTPSATAQFFGIRGKKSKAGVKTGLGLRPII